jgi:uncharacterized membrane protein
MPKFPQFRAALVMALAAGSATPLSAQVFRGLGMNAPDIGSYGGAAFPDGLGALAYSYRTGSGEIHGFTVRVDPNGQPIGGATYRAGYCLFTGCSHDGAIVVGSAGQACIFDPLTSRLTMLGTFPGGTLPSSASACSADGSVIVGYAHSSAGHDEAFRKVGTGPMEPLGLLGSGEFAQSGASAVSADGSIVVGATDSDEGGGGYGTPEVAFRWTAAGGMEALGWLDDYVSRSGASDISADGSTVVGSSLVHEVGGGYVYHGFRWTAAGGMRDIGQPGCGQAVNPVGVSADGSVIIGTVECGPHGQSAFIWTPSLGLVDLIQFAQMRYGVDFGSWALFGATGISDDGRVIVGYGQNPAGISEGWMLRLLASPAACRADMTGEGRVDVQDFLLFLQRYAGADARADFDGDGRVSVQDFLAFLAGFAAGCG